MARALVRRLNGRARATTRYLSQRFGTEFCSLERYSVVFGSGGQVSRSHSVLNASAYGYQMLVPPFKPSGLALHSLPTAIETPPFADERRARRLAPFSRRCGSYALAKSCVGGKRRSFAYHRGSILESTERGAFTPSPAVRERGPGGEGR